MTNRNNFHNRRRILNRFIVLLAGVFGLTTIQQTTSALTIERTFIPSGTELNVPIPVEPFEFTITASDAPASAVGGGNLIDIFNTAADFWESTILDDHTVSISFGWADFSAIDPGRIAHIPLDQSGVPLRENASVLGFSTSFDDWFLDSTPADNSEYQTLNESFADLGGGSLNTGRTMGSPVGDADGKFDLLSMARHAIGHSLALSQIQSFVDEAQDGTIDVTSPRPFAGSAIPTLSSPDQVNPHLDILTASLGTGAGPGGRNLGSVVDVLAVAQVAQFESVNLNAVPEPSSLGLSGIALIGFLAAVRRRSFVA